MKVLFANIGWMARYQGLYNGYKIVGGGSYEDKHEVFNFLEIDGYCYGYVQAPGENCALDLRRIDACCPESDQELDGVLVIWTATHPKNGGTRIVGWYRNATVYRERQISGEDARNKYSYNIRARATDCYCVPEDKRNFRIIRQKTGFMGQANVWYAQHNSPEVQKHRQQALDWIKNYGKEKVRLKAPIGSSDTEHRKEVEQAAVDYVCKQYKELGYSVVSVESENKGWDLEAGRDGLRLLIEVKGLSGSELAVRLSPNEYQMMQKYSTEGYRLCVVTEALKQPYLTTFVYQDGQWVAEEDRRLILSFEEIVSAIARLRPTEG